MKHRRCISFEPISIKEFINFFPENDLLKSGIFGHIDFKAPPGTVLDAGVGRIALKNDFVKINFIFKQAGDSSRAGELVGHLAGLKTSEIEKFWSANYTINIEATFNPLRPGHPEMQNYRDWVNKIFEEFKFYFDSENHWKMTKESYLFYKDFPLNLTEEPEKQSEMYREWLKEHQIENSSAR